MNIHPKKIKLLIKFHCTSWVNYTWKTRISQLTNGCEPNLSSNWYVNIIGLKVTRTDLAHLTRKLDIVGLQRVLFAKLTIHNQVCSCIQHSQKTQIIPWELIHSLCTKCCIHNVSPTPQVNVAVTPLCKAVPEESCKVVFTKSRGS